VIPRQPDPRLPRPDRGSGPPAIHGIHSDHGDGAISRHEEASSASLNAQVLRLPGSDIPSSTAPATFLIITGQAERSKGRNVVEKPRAARSISIDDRARSLSRRMMHEEEGRFV
jgi:hypothetical protein